MLRMQEEHIIAIYVPETGWAHLLHGGSMSQITLYLDDATLKLVERGAQAQGISKSRWVAALIRKHSVNEWSPDCLALAGRFPDFPLREDAPEQQNIDVPRIGF